MKILITRRVETADERLHVDALRHDYYVVSRELDAVADWTKRPADDRHGAHIQYFATYAGDDLVGCFRTETGSPAELAFGADWAFGDFVEELPEEVAVISGLCTVSHLRDRARVLSHMVRECVAIAKEFDLPHVFFETSPELWPEFHASGLVRKGGALVDPRTGLQSAVYRLDCRSRVRFPHAAALQMRDEASEPALTDQQRPQLAIVMGGRR